MHLIIKSKYNIKYIYNIRKRKIIEETFLKRCNGNGNNSDVGCKNKQNVNKSISNVLNIEEFIKNEQDDMENKFLDASLNNISNDEEAVTFNEQENNKLLVSPPIKKSEPDLLPVDIYDVGNSLNTSNSNISKGNKIELYQKLVKEYNFYQRDVVVKEDKKLPRIENDCPQNVNLNESKYSYFPRNNSTSVMNLNITDKLLFPNAKANEAENNAKKGLRIKTFYQPVKISRDISPLPSFNMLNIHKPDIRLKPNKFISIYTRPKKKTDQDKSTINVDEILKKIENINKSRNNQLAGFKFKYKNVSM
jgi:hypothetical protein